jgi:hypothetical protein
MSKLTESIKSGLTSFSENTQELLRMHSIGVDKKNNTLFPAKYPNGSSKKPDNILSTLPSQALTIFNNWLKDSSSGMEKYKHISALFKDMNILFNNNAILSKGILLTADETIQVDDVKTSITVEAKKAKQRQFIEKFYGNINVLDYLWEVAFNIVLYGNAGWMPTFDGTNGITEIIPIDITTDLKQRIEFSPSEAMKQAKKKGSYVNQLSSNLERMKFLVDTISKESDYSSLYKTYLFGFEVGDILLPPWRFIHFRNVNTNSLFKPWGTPLYMHALAAHKEYEATMALQKMARAFSFPLEVYSLSLPNSGSITDKMESALEFMDDLNNVGLKQVKKDSDGIGERIITIKDVMDIDVVERRMDIDAIKDIEILIDNLIRVTGLPRSFLDPNASSVFGSSGVSLVEQFKPFARLVYKIQSRLLEGLVRMTKIHMLQTKAFSLDEIDFKISLPYPESQADRDRLGVQSDQLRLVNDMIDSIAGKVMGENDAKLPADVIKSIYLKFLPYQPEWIENIIDKTIAERGASEEEGDGTKFEAREYKKIFENKSQINKIIDETIYEESFKLTNESVHQGRHFYSSSTMDKDLDFKKHYVEFSKYNLKNKLEEVVKK